MEWDKSFYRKTDVLILKKINLVQLSIYRWPPIKNWIHFNWKDIILNLITLLICFLFKRFSNKSRWIFFFFMIWSVNHYSVSVKIFLRAVFIYLILKLENHFSNTLHIFLHIIVINNYNLINNMNPSLSISFVYNTKKFHEICIFF